MQLAVDGPVDAGWGLGLAVGFDASLARRVNGGRIDASISSLAALVRWQALTDSPVSFAFLGGVGLEVVTVRAEGFTHNLRDSIPVASLRLGARCRWSITGPLGAILAADLALLAREERFNVIGYGRALTVSPVRARALAGFSLDF